MKNHSIIYLSISEKRFRRKLKSKKKKRNKRFKSHQQHIKDKQDLGNDFSYSNIIDKWLPPNVKFLISNKKSDFELAKIEKKARENDGTFMVPNHFSLIENPNESYYFIQQVLGVLLNQQQLAVNIDYSNCEKADLGAQVLLDIILKDIILFFKRCDHSSRTSPKVKEINGVNVKNENVRKLLFSVGSPAIHSNKTINFHDIIPYPLCVHNREASGDPMKISEQKDIDTTKLADYVLSSLERMGKKLTPEKLDDLCVVISEILINAEEHSTTKNRFSIGYFHEVTNNDTHYGVLRLVILNFGETIYEKFKSLDCPNKQTVNKMNLLSKDFTKRKIFFNREFEEETLWTLYALQEGVTSIAPEAYRKRGNGSIQFIESFFNIKGKNGYEDKVSKMAILSGNTSIIFDGKYAITERENSNGEKFKYMTFNDSGNIENKPDKKYVKYVDDYFPGTIISAKILFNEDDLIDEIK